MINPHYCPDFLAERHLLYDIRCSRLFADGELRRLLLQLSSVPSLPRRPSPPAGDVTRFRLLPDEVGYVMEQITLFRLNVKVFWVGRQLTALVGRRTDAGR